MKASIMGEQLGSKQNPREGAPNFDDEDTRNTDKQPVISAEETIPADSNTNNTDSDTSNIVQEQIRTRPLTNVAADRTKQYPTRE